MKFVFLVYVSRSGSTFLARNLSENSSNLVVLPEIDLLNLLSIKGEDNVKRLNAKELFKLMEYDHRLMNIGLGHDDLQLLAERNAGKGIRLLMEALVYEYAEKVQGKTPKIALIKRGALIYHYERLEKLFPEAIYLHVLRDPRGVVNSIVHTNRAYFPNEKMGRGSVYYAAQQWVKFQKRINILKRKGNLHIVEFRYEELRASVHEIIRSIIKQIGANNTICRGFPSKDVFNIAKKEEKIHKLVKKSFDCERTYAWKHELSYYQGTVTEIVVRDLLTEKKYPLYFLKKVHFMILPCYLVCAYITYISHSVLFYSARVRHYLANPSRLRTRIELIFR